MTVSILGISALDLMSNAGGPAGSRAPIRSPRKILGFEVTRGAPTSARLRLLAPRAGVATGKSRGEAGAGPRARYDPSSRESSMASSMFRLAHLSDPHLGPLPPVRLRELMNKRLTGYANWRLGRADAQDMDILSALIADVKAERPDHIAVTGDFANIGLASEFATTRRFLESLGTPEGVSAIPGNHDIYVSGSAAALTPAIGPWMQSDGKSEPSFPFLKRRGRVALIGLSTGVPTPVFVAAGRLGSPQIERLDAMLESLGREKAIRILLIHHPPHKGGARRLRQLTDGAHLRQTLARRGCEAVLHGHNHRASIA